MEYNYPTLQEVITAITSRNQPVQLVKNYDELSDAELNRIDWDNSVAELKYDGVYCAIMNTSDCGIVVLSRSGNRFYFQEEVLRELLADSLVMSRPLEQCVGHSVLIAELINTDMSLEGLSGLVNTNRTTPWTDAECMTMVQSGSFMYHDCIPSKFFMEGRDSASYRIRRKQLEYIARDSNIVQFSKVSDEEQWLGFSDEVIDANWEGAVLKQLNAPWVAGPKSINAVKRVRGVHLDLRCTGWALGKGKRSAQVAKLHFEYNGKPFSADLGKGWTDAKRDELTARATAWNNTVTGKVFHVKGLCISSKGVIRLPKVQEERVDKPVADGEV